VLISVPLAVLAVGAGIAAQALLQPTTTLADRDLLDTLIAQPTPPPPLPQATGTVPPAATRQQGELRSEAIRAQRSAGPSAPGALAEPQAGPELALEIRVALLRLPAHPRLAATGSWRLVDRQGRVLRQGTADQSPDADSLLATEPEVWLESQGSLLAEGRPYAGRFRLLRAAEGLQVINHLSLENYISSVVGAEMPSHWDMEALKAQAVAARSYAMAHMARPADPHWHLGDTTRWQAYRGLESVTDRTAQATAGTAGVILSYQGGIVESLYAATHQISREAHGHLGASMSQHGAQDLALQGLRYNEILGRYYQGASLARLQAGEG
jgi:hypothetical protein